MDSFNFPVFSAVLPVDTYAPTLADLPHSPVSTQSFTGGYVVMVTAGQLPPPPK